MRDKGLRLGRKILAPSVPVMSGTKFHTGKFTVSEEASLRNRSLKTYFNILHSTRASHSLRILRRTLYCNGNSVV